MTSDIIHRPKLKKVILVFDIHDLYTYVKDKDLIKYLFLYALDKSLGFNPDEYGATKWLVDPVLESRLNKFNINLKDYVTSILFNTMFENKVPLIASNIETFQYFDVQVKVDKPKKEEALVTFMRYDYEDKYGGYEYDK